MTDEDRISLGEVLRNIELVRRDFTEMRAEQKEDRHRLADSINRIMVQQGEDRTRLGGVENDVTDLQTDMKAVRRDAAFLSGGISLGAFLWQFVPWGKH